MIGIVHKGNPLLGWLWSPVRKRFACRKPRMGRHGWSELVAALAALGGVLVFRRRWKGFHGKTADA